LNFITAKNTIITGLPIFYVEKLKKCLTEKSADISKNILNKY